MNGIDLFLDRKCCSLLEGNAFQSNNWKIIRMIVVVRMKCFEVTFISQLEHCRREK